MPPPDKLRGPRPTLAHSQAPSMKVGVAVTLTGLKRTDLNGRRGYLCGPQHPVPLTTAGRWPVQLTSSYDVSLTADSWDAAEPVCDDPLLVREENLIAEPAADELIESILTDSDCVLCILGQLDTAAQVPQQHTRTLAYTLTPTLLSRAPSHPLSLTIPQLGAAAAVSRLWRAQCEEDASPLWAQLFARRYAPLSQAGGHCDAMAGTTQHDSARVIAARAATAAAAYAAAVAASGAVAMPPPSMKERMRLYSTARAAFRLRAALPPATCNAAFDFAQNVQRLDEGTFVSQADTRHLDMFQSGPLAVSKLGSCASSGRAWRLWVARHSQEEPRPLGAQPLPRVLERAASKATGFTAFDHSGTWTANPSFGSRLTCCR